MSFADRELDNSFDKESVIKILFLPCFMLPAVLQVLLCGIGADLYLRFKRECLLTVNLILV